jgi:LPS-assembly protein
LSWPILLGRYAPVAPFARAGEWLYNVGGNDPNVDDGFGNRLYSSAGTELSSYISRVYNFSWGPVTRIKHVIKPLVTYEYSAISQTGNLPEFDPLDVEDSVHRVTYELRNDITARIKGPGGRTLYRDIMRFRLLQSYDIKEAQRELFGPDDDRKPFSNIRGEIELYPYMGVVLLADTTFSPYDGEFKTFNTYVRAADTRGDLIQLDYRYTQDSVEEFNAFLNVRVTQNFDVLGYSKTSLDDSTTVEAGAGFGLRFQCWGIRFLYSDNSEERSVGLTFSLSGLGDIRALSFDI